MATDLMKKFGYTLLLCMCFSPPGAWGEVLQDPTRPPPGIGDPTQAAGLMAYPQERGLQSVIISPEHCAAIIDGKTVELGGRYGDQRLVEVTERGVVLLGENGRHAMTLFPAVGMKITSAAPGQQAVTCKLGQNKQAKSPAKSAGQKEKK